MTARDERGTVALVTAGIVTVVLVIAAFVVDVGMQRVARRDVQALADVVALDLARLVDGRTADEIKGSATPDTASLAAALDASLARNVDDVVGDADSLEVDPYLVRLDADGGFRRTGDGRPVEVTGGERPDAVVVVARTDVGFGFAPIIGVSEGSASREAVGRNGGSACFKLGTTLLGLASDDSVLNAILGDALGIAVLGYAGLADATVSLGDLQAELQALSPDAVLDLASVELGDLTLALAHALSNTPGSNVADIELLEQISSQIGVFAPIDVGDLLGVQAGGGSALGATVNVLDLLTSSAFVANGSDAISVPDLNLDLPGAGQLSTELSVVSPAKTGCVPGTGVAETAQASLVIEGRLNIPILGVLRLRGDVRIEVDLARSAATLQSVECDDRGRPTAMTIDVANKGLGSIRLDLGATTVFGEPPEEPEEPGEPGQPEEPGEREEPGEPEEPAEPVEVPLIDLAVEATQPPVTGTQILALPQYLEPTYFSVPGSGPVLPDVTADQIDVLGLELGDLLGPLIADVLDPLVEQVNVLLVDQLAPSLGLRLAGVDLTAVPTPACAGPLLIG